MQATSYHEVSAKFEEFLSKQQKSPTAMTNEFCEVFKQVMDTLKCQYEGSEEKSNLYNCLEIKIN